MNSSQLKEKVLKGSFWSLLGSSGHQIFGLIIFIILSRILTPVDFGVMAISLVFIEAVSTLARLGLSEVLIRSEKLDSCSTSTVFWTSLCAGIFVSIFVYVLSGSVARIFDAPQLENILKSLAIIPTIYASCTVQEGLLQRNFGFKALAYRTLISTSIAGVISIVLALNGYGIYSLVFQRISTELVVMILLWSYTGWLPKLTFSTSVARQQCVMGAPLMSSSFLIAITTRIMDVIVGFFLGAAAVGYLRIAGKLHDFVVKFTIRPVVGVALAAFSKIQNDKKALSRTYRRFAQLCGLLTFPAFLGLAVIAPEFMSFLFGEQWAVSGQLMQVLCIASVSSTLNYFFKPLMTAIGKPGLVLKVNALQFVLTIIFATAASQFNVIAVMIGHVIVTTIVTVVIMFLVQKHVEVKISLVAKAFFPPILLSMIMCAVLFALKSVLILTINPLLMIAILVSLGGIIYIAGLFVFFPSYMRNIHESVMPTVLSSLKRNK